MSIVIYLYGYLGIGVAVLLVVFISHRLSVKSEPDLHAILDSLHPERDTWHYKLINKVLVPLLVAIFMPCVWPVIIYWKAKELISRNEFLCLPIDNYRPHTRHKNRDKQRNQYFVYQLVVPSISFRMERIQNRMKIRFRLDRESM